MALIQCPECGKEVSDKALDCPSCGYVFKKKNSRKSKVKLVFIFVLAFFIVLGIGYGITIRKKNLENVKGNQKEEFRKCEEKMELIRLAQVGDVVTFGNYAGDLEWVVAFDDNRHLLLLTKETIAYMKYVSSEAEFTWENSDIRKWLNEDLYNEAFSEEEKKYVESVLVNNGDEKKTGDRLFILSEGEGAGIFPNEKIRELVFDGGETIWLRSSSEEMNGKYYGDCLMEYGTSYSYGKAEVGCKNGIHAALWINATDK